MLVERTTENLALAEAVRARMYADARIVNAKAALWRLAGHGLLATGVGVGLGVAFLGYSFVTEKRASAEETAAAISAAKRAPAEIADALSTALARTRLKVEGVLQIAPDAAVGVKPGQSVALAPGAKVQLSDGGSVALKSGATVGMSPDTSVKLDPNAIVNVKGTLNTNIARQTDAQPASKAKVMTYITKFQTVDFPPGSVVTGWRYDDSNQDRPSHQYCYYTQTLDENAEAQLDIGANGKFTRPKRVPKGLNLSAAFQNCVWYQ